MGNGPVFLLRHKAGPPMIGAEGFFKASRIHFHAAITERGELDPVSVELLQAAAEFYRSSVVPLQKDIDSDQLLRCPFPFASLVVGSLPRRSRIGRLFQLLR